MAAQSYQLVMRSGPNPGQTFELIQNEITIGRDIGNTIVINDAEMSRKHARLFAQAGGYVLEDTGSTNGTFVNGQRLMGPHLLRPGEVIFFGETVSLAFEAQQFDPNATMVGGRQPAPAAQRSPRDTYMAPAPQPVQQPMYSGQVPPGPDYELPAEQGSNNRNLIIAGCGCLLVLVCVVVVAAVAFDSLNLYCTAPFDAFFACP
jgi:predicted component of type VI protein secretion system